jgi:hypothetical protein
MNGKTLVVLALAIGAASGAYAQAVYKTVGPDGKVIYSDKPPAGAGSRTTTVGKPPTAAASAPALEARPARKPAVSPVKAATAPAASEPAAESPARQEARMDPILERALIRVMGYEDLLSRTEDVCLQTLPTSFKRYSAAASGWKQRHAALLAQYRKVMAEGVTDAQRERLEARVQDTNESNMAVVLGAPMSSKINWCDQSFKEIAAGKLDLHDDPGVAGPLMSYRP